MEFRSSGNTRIELLFGRNITDFRLRLIIGATGNTERRVVSTLSELIQAPNNPIAFY